MSSLKFNNTLVVSLLGGPGCGKSIFAADIFAKLKWQGIVTEIATEYAKDKVYEESFRILENQIYIFGKQHHRINRVLGKTQVIVTDSPFLLGAAYIKDNNVLLENLIIEEYKKLNTLNIFLNRNVEIYEQYGRIQDLQQAIQIDIKIKDLLYKYNISFIEYKSEKQTSDEIVKKILKTIDNGS
jgi:nicotinamide riboside kinase